MTTIKVETAVRDQLASVARARGVTMAGLLRQVASDLEERQRWAMVEASYDRLKADDPQAWQEYLAELRAWDSAAGDPADATAEWPEYNR